MIRRIILKQVGGKTVYVFEDHATALVPWAEVHQRVGGPLYLITLDNHSDAKEALIDYGTRIKGIPIDETRRLRICANKILKRIDLSKQADVLGLVKKLRNTEQLDAAIRLGIFTKVFTLNFASTDSDNAKIIQIGDSVHSQFSIIRQLSGTDDWKDFVLEDDVLNLGLITINKNLRAHLVNGLFEKKYILDFDCDVIHTIRALKPLEKSVLYRLISKAQAITIARESSYIRQDLSDDPELRHEVDWYERGLTSQKILRRLLTHIRKAQNAHKPHPLRQQGC